MTDYELVAKYVDALIEHGKDNIITGSGDGAE